MSYPSLVVSAVLGFGGLLPFIVTLAGTLGGITLAGFDPRWVFASYSVVILSFLGGVLWGRGLSAGSTALARATLLVSNAITLLGWLGLVLMLTLPVSAIGLLALCYLAILLWEWRFYDWLYPGVDRRYLTLRVVLSCLVIGGHLVMLSVV